MDGITNEVWRYEERREMREWVRKFCNRVRKGVGWPEGWKEGVLVPILKKGEKAKIEDYRDVTLMSTLYKMYMGG